MIDGLRIHRLTANEWALWRQVRLRALAESPEAFGSKLADWQGAGDTEERWRERFDHVEFNAVALHQAQPVGAVGGMRHDDGRLELVSMWVAPECRGEGIGTVLIDAVLDWATQSSATDLLLAVRRGNLPAIALYERTGFVVSGPNPHDAAEDLMVRTL